MSSKCNFPSNLLLFQVDVMFKALSECQVLHPDPQEQGMWVVHVVRNKLCEAIY